jgi:hypothetical protein
MSTIDAHETEIIGRWVWEKGAMVSDATCGRIDDLTRNYLVEVGRDKSGWDLLFRDPKDGRYWQLSYPNSDLHGGGPPQLTHLTKELALEKYDVNS